MAKTFAKDLKRNRWGRAIKSAIAKRANRIHHFSHQSGTNIVMRMEIAAIRTIKIERGIKAC